MSPSVRLLAAAAAFAAWLVLLFAGIALGGAVHLVALGGVLLIPWRAARAPASTEEPPTWPSSSASS